MSINGILYSVRGKGWRNGVYVIEAYAPDLSDVVFEFSFAFSPERSHD